MKLFKLFVHKEKNIPINKTNGRKEEKKIR